MNQRKARKLRKELGMTKENLRNKDNYNVINKVKKVVYFTDALGQLVPQQAVRAQIVNTNLNFYRKQKKLITRGFHNGK